MTSYTNTTLNYPQLSNSPIRRVIAKRSPTANDKRNFTLGDEWLNEIANQWWKLVSVNNITGAFWVLVSAEGAGIISLTGNSGGAVMADMNMNINVIGASPIDISGNPGTNTLTVSSDGTVATNYIEDTGTATPSSGNLNVVGGVGITTHGSGNSVTIAVNDFVPLTFTEDTGVAAAVAANINIVGGTGVDTVGSGSTITINASSSVPTTFVEDAGSATPSSNILNIVGGTGISTSGAGSTVTITALAPTNLTFTENSGTATPSLGNLNVLGTATNGINTTGASDTVTVSMQSPYADGDFEFRSSISGDTRTLLVDNTSNTASSQAIVEVMTAGTSAGDPWFQTTIGGNRSYSIGPSNSFSGDLRINTNNSSSVSPTTGVNLWNMTPAGIRTIPTQPAFFAIAPTQNSVTGDGTSYAAQFTNVAIDRQSNYNAGTGVFTAPATGIYLLSVNLSCNGISPTHTQGFVDINTTGFTYRGCNLSFAAVRNSSNGLQLPFSVMAPMVAGDTASISFTVMNGTKTVNMLTSSIFTGVLLF